MNASEFFIFGFDGLNLSPKTHQFITSNPLGGVILFKRNIASLEQVVSLTTEVIEATLVNPCFISVDQEGGSVARLRGICTDLPAMSSLEHLFNTPEKIFRIGASLGRELVALGINLNFAPVCDVRNHDNPLINDRSFSCDPNKVAALAVPFIQGMQASGVAGCAKHFPGHGRTVADSHLTRPTVLASLAELNEAELVPFRAAINGGVATIMTAHILYRTIDAHLIATLSPMILDNILRKDLGFTGLIISDDLDMKGIADHHELAEALELGLEAGVDLFIIGNDFEKTKEAIDLLNTAIKRSASLEKKAIAALSRIRSHKMRFVGAPRAPELDEAKAMVRCRPHLDLMSALL